MGETAKKDKELLYFIIYIAIASLGWIIPPIAPITEAGMKLLSVFIAAIIGWSVSSSVWPSLLTFALLPFTGLTNLAGVMSLSWGSDTVLFMVFMMAIIAFLEATGTTAFMASWLMSRKMLEGHPWRLIFMILLCGWALSTFCGNFPGQLLTWGFIYQICDILGYKPFDKFPNLMIFGVTIMGAISLSTLPWSMNALVILGSYTASSGVAINAAHYAMYSLPVGFMCIFGFMLLAKFMFRLDVSDLKNFTPDAFEAKDKELTKERKIGLITLAVFIIVLLVPSLLPTTNPIRIVSDTMGLSIKGALICLVLVFIKVDGKRIFDSERMAIKGVPWNMMMMIIGILSFVGLLGNPAAGISAFLASVFTPMFQGVSPIVFMILVLVITVFMTNFMINMVVAVIMISATLPIAVSMGIDPLQIVYLITLSCTIAFFLPAASAASCVMFANTKWVRAKDVYKYSLPTIIMMSVIALGWNVIMFLFF
ncbi:MAG: SLC13 family permease [Peptococcaceae bacterium]|nr:SLC13 family permease [Peptococcaceae bacterium]